MKLESKYNLNEIVTIIALEQEGTIRVIRWAITGLYYTVTYWLEGKLEEALLGEEELRKYAK